MTRFHWTVVIAVVAIAVTVVTRPTATLPIVIAIAVAFVIIVALGVTSMRRQFFYRSVSNGNRGRAEVALTYDDGPDPLSTPGLIALLAEHNVRVTFFFVGERVRAEAELTRQCKVAGHLIENHTDRHLWYTNFLSKRAMIRSVTACNAAIEQATGVRPRYFRPPYGMSSPATGPAARALGLTIVGWDVRGLDLPTSHPEAVVRRILRNVKAGSIILLHDGGRNPVNVVEATRAVLEGLRERGLRPVRLDELLRSDPAP